MRARHAVLAWILATASVVAFAHAFLDHADPKVGSTVAVAPGEVRLWFTQELEPAFSTAEVVDASGKRVDGGHASVDAKDGTLLRVPLDKLPAGTYTVNWRSVSVDTHATQGRFTFRVGP